MTNKPSAEQLARSPVKVTSPEEIEANGLRRLAATAAADGTDAIEAFDAALDAVRPRGEVDVRESVAAQLTPKDLEEYADFVARLPPSALVVVVPRPSDPSPSEQKRVRGHVAARVDEWYETARREPPRPGQPGRRRKPTPEGWELHAMIAAVDAVWSEVQAARYDLKRYAILVEALWPLSGYRRRQVAGQLTRHVGFNPTSIEADVDVLEPVVTELLKSIRPSSDPRDHFNQLTKVKPPRGFIGQLARTMLPLALSEIPPIKRPADGSKERRWLESAVVALGKGKIKDPRSLVVSVYGRVWGKRTITRRLDEGRAPTPSTD